MKLTKPQAARVEAACVTQCDERYVVEILTAADEPLRAYIADMGAFGQLACCCGAAVAEYRRKLTRLVMPAPEETK